MSKESRSLTMSRIRAKGNASTELIMGELLRKYGIEGWSCHEQMIGKPDFTFAEKRLRSLLMDASGMDVHAVLQILSQTWSIGAARSQETEHEIDESPKH